MEHHKKEAPVHAYPLDDSTLNRANVAATALFAFLGEWMILLVTCSIAFFFIPLTPAFTLQSTSASVLNVTTQNLFTTNLGVEFLVDDSNPLGSSIYYDSLYVTLFHRQESLSTFSLPSSFHQHQPTKTAIQAKFPNVSLMVDEWNMDYGASCGFVYLDLRFGANVRYTQPMWPVMRDALQGHCGEVKVELCSSATNNTVVHSFLASCDVYSDLVHKVRLVMLVLLILLLVTAVGIPLLVEQFFCSSNTFS
ncbi:hypothetical protein SESBI_01817 [Sesbania bispinosa]|nr:hypothetical protein SESBI_01817 [Sesbania bispinosa]